MNKDTLYVTVRMIEDFVIPLYRQTGKRLFFSEVIQKMNEQGLLSPHPLPEPKLDASLSSQEFIEAFYDLPYNASDILEYLENDRSDLFREEEAVFPPGQDMFCRKLIPYLANEPRTMSYFDVFYVVRGGCQVLLGASPVTLRTGDLCVIPPDAIHAARPDEEDYVAKIAVRASTFDTRFSRLMTQSGVVSGFFRESLYNRGQPNYLLLHTPPRDRLMGQYLKNMIAESSVRDDLTNGCAISWLTLFFARAVRSCGDAMEVFRVPGGGSARADCGEILQYIQQNYRTVRLSTLAREFHYNETYLSRMLQSYAKKSFTEIVRDIRMKRAEEYLRNSSLRVHEIAALVGYSSVDHFSRAFKSTHGMSPQAYRKKDTEKNR